ncbi:MAG: hypothetical protein ACI9BW_000605 [Gammaproteobacteria bacterium]|jgi:hypothetical protein
MLLVDDLFSICSSVGCIVRQSELATGRHAMTNQEQISATRQIVTPPIRPLSRALTLAVLALLVGLSTSSALAAEQVEPALTVPEINRDTADATKQCTWACLKWSKMCNVDPRGVYKCRRTCANFGEICE